MLLKYGQEDFMITSGSVGGIYIYPRMTDELIAEAMRRSAEAMKKSGNGHEVIVTEELLKRGPCVLAVPNEKRKIGVMNRVDAHPEEVAKLLVKWHKDEAWLKTLRTKRHVPDWLMRWAYPPAKYGKKITTAEGSFFDPYFNAPKPDKYGLPWGKIEEHDKTESEKLKKLYSTKTMQQLMASGTKFGDSEIHYADIRFLYELVEETGYLAVRERLDAAGQNLYLQDGVTPIYDSLFERFVTLYQFDRSDPNDQTIEHEVYLFRVKEVLGELNEEGAPGETGAPEILPVVSLTSKNFYPKHAHGIMILLDKMVKEEGKSEYIDALKYLQVEFPPKPGIYRREPYIREPNLNLPDNEMFKEMFKDVRPLK